MLPSQELINLPEQKQLRIGEVADLFSLQAHVLRYWEKEFEQLSPRKTSSNQRSYAKKDLEIIWIIKFLLYEQNFTMIGASAKLTEIVSQNLSIDQVIEHFKTMFDRTKASGNREQEARHLVRVEKINGQLKSQLQDAQKTIRTLQAKLAEASDATKIVEALTHENNQLEVQVESLTDTVEDLQTKLEQHEHPKLDFELTIQSLQSVRARLSTVLQEACEL